MVWYIYILLCFSTVSSVVGSPSAGGSCGLSIPALMNELTCSSCPRVLTLYDKYHDVTVVFCGVLSGVCLPDCGVPGAVVSWSESMGCPLLMPVRGFYSCCCLA